MIVRLMCILFMICVQGTAWAQPDPGDITVTVPAENPSSGESEEPSGAVPTIEPSPDDFPSVDEQPTVEVEGDDSEGVDPWSINHDSGSERDLGSDYNPASGPRQFEFNLNLNLTIDITPETAELLSRFTTVSPAPHAGVFAAAPASQQVTRRQTAAERVFVIVAGSRETNLQRGFESNVANMQAMFNNIKAPPGSAVPDGHQNAIQTPNFTLNTILQRIRALKGNVKSTDVVVMYITTHGGVFTSGENRWDQVFTLDSGSVSRSELFKELDELGAGLTVLISDACSVTTASSRPGVRAFPAPPSDYTMFELLLYYSTGDIQVTSSSFPTRLFPQGQYSWFPTDGSGGIFTLALLQNIYTPADRSGGSYVVNWGKFFAPVVSETQARYRRINFTPQQSVDPQNKLQTPQIAYIPSR